MKVSLVVMVLLSALALASAQTATTPLQNLYSGASLIVLYVLAGVQIAVGIFLVLLGFRLWKFTSGVIGFLLGFFLLYYIVMYFWGTIDNAAWIALGSGIGAGILIGLLLFFFPTIALFVVSFIVGLALGVLIYDVALVYTGWQYAFFISVGVCALVLVLIAICLRKPFIIVLTSFYGAFLIASGIAVYVGPQYFQIVIDPSNPAATTFVWQTYVFLAGIIAVTILGIILQACVFAKDISWDNVRKHLCPTARHERYNDELGTPLMER